MTERFMFSTAIAITALVLSITLLKADPVEPVDPLMADPNGVAAQVILPDNVALPEDGAVMVVSGVNTLTRAVSSEQYVLIPSEQRDLYVLSRDDQTRLAQQQGLILGWMAEDIDVDGAFNFTIAPCQTGGEPDGQARVSIQLRAEVEGPFLPIVENMRLRSLLGHDLSELQVCSRAG
ncbi:hypothetical protein E2K80_15405 [Rhodophyticola sp. CCM32]|uniref:hypothetical protein n=1 Tax=Rhodophyticola sp. CCM32 TaxID=2916397 RepID=UPI00107F6076|nr:hypothetical protein [Rhodophyticola sp. CCM32]QBY01938.1 hypothetical protein E2K80_15405 [Rhodophyticola sp. CCM32]